MASSEHSVDQFHGLSEERLEGLLRSTVGAYSDGDLEDAKRILKGVLRLAPDDPRAFKLMGSICLIEQRSAQAREYLQRAYELDPDDPYVLVGLLEVFIDTNRWGAAREVGERLAQIDAEAPSPAGNRGRMLLERARARVGSA